MKKHTEKTKKPSKLESLTIATVQDLTHSSSVDIARYRTITTCQFNTVDSQINDLTITLMNAKEERSRLAAILSGLEQIMSNR